jgi:imidazolonepropionase-like amidohydrolase
MRISMTLGLCLFFLSACAPEIPDPPPVSADAVLYEGARLIVGDDTPVIESSAFLVEDGVFTRVGPVGDIAVPDGTSRVDLTGKTVMPALVDGHAHLGYQDIATSVMSADNYNRENLVDHLEHYAYYGIAAVRNLGTDPGDMPFELREQVIPGTALYRTAGRGIAMPNAGPNAAYYRPSAYGVTNEEEARAVVQELAQRNVDVVKIWVDDRGGSVEKLQPELYRPIIEEAHSLGLQVVAHMFYLADAKALVEAGIDGFAHGVRDQDIDDELIALLGDRPDIYFIPNLPNRGAMTEDDLSWLAESVPDAEVERMRGNLTNRTPESIQQADDFFSVQARNLMRLKAEGVTIAFGSDAGTSIGWTAHEELTDLVAAGLTPGEAIMAATSTAAAVVGLDQLGSISNGKSADFIVLDADPLDDINNTRRISNVYLRGGEVDRDAMRAAWAGN